MTVTFDPILRPDGPGTVATGQRVMCLPGSLPTRDGGQGMAVLTRIGSTTSLVDVYGGAHRRVRNALLHPQAGPVVAAERRSRGLLTTSADGRRWLPGWTWLDWTVAQHLAYRRGELAVPAPPPAPPQMIIVACGRRKADAFETPAGQMYLGSYHQAARRAADAIASPGTRIMIISARYGLLNLDDRIMRYEQRLGRPGAVTGQGLREQAEQLGVRGVGEVVVLAPKAYAELARVHVWPYAITPLSHSRGIGEQLACFAALAATASLGHE